MAFDVYPAASVPLRLREGEPSALIPLRVRSAVDPATGRDLMFLALVKVGAGCAAPGPPDPTLRLRVGTGEPVVVAGPDPVPLRAQAGPDAGPTVALATRAAVGPDRWLVTVEILQPGHPWALQIEHHGPADEHGFTWVVADDEAETGQPWIDVPTDPLRFRVKVGHRHVLPVSIANRGTGVLALTGADGADLGSGFTLVDVTPRNVEPHTCATARIGFTGSAVPGTSSLDVRVGSDDPTAALSGHPETLALRATTVEPVQLISRIECPDVGGLVALSPDGRLLAVSSARFRFVGEDRFFDKAFVRIYDTDAGTLRATATFGKFIWSVAFDPAGTRIAVTSGGDLWMADASTGAELWHFPHIFGTAVLASFSADGRWLVVGWNALVARIDARTGAPFWQMATGGHGVEQVRAVSLSSDGRFVAVGSGDNFTPGGRLRLLDAASGQERWRVDRPDSVAAVAFSSDGSALVIAGSHTSAAIVDAADGAVRGSLPHPTDPLREVEMAAFSPDGRLAVTRDVFRTRRVFDVATRTVLQTFPRQSPVGGPAFVGFTSDSRYLVLPGVLNQVRLVDPVTGVERVSATYPVLPAEIPAEPGDVSHTAAWVDLGRDGRRLVIAGRKRAVVYDPLLDVP
jgi:WD40 repeat protein